MFLRLKWVAQSRTRAVGPTLTACALMLASLQASGQGNPPTTTPIPDKSTEKRPSKLVEIGLEAALERAQSAYQAGRYDACAKGYGEILAHVDELRAEVAPPTVEQARLYDAACLLAIGDMAAADEQLRSALGDNPLMASPDPVVFPDQVRDLFFKVKADFLDEIQRVQDTKLELARQEANKRLEQVRQERLRVERLEAAARTETLIHQNHRWIAFVPFGVGQFQNGDDLWGGVLLGAQLLTLGGAVVGVSGELGVHSYANGGKNVEKAESVNVPINDLRLLGTLASASFLFLAVVGVMEANVNFVEERPAGSRSRDLPKNLRPVSNVSVVPSVGATSSSFNVGASGTF